MTEPPETLNFAAAPVRRPTPAAPRKIAYVDDRAGLSYGRARGPRRAASPRPCSALGVRREERVLLLMLDSNEWPVAFLGALYAGIVPVAVNTLLTADDYAYMLAHSRAQAAIVSAALAPTLRQGDGAGAERGRARVIVARRGRSRSPAPARLDFDSLVAASRAARRAGRDARRRPGLLALFVGLDRQARRARCTRTPTPGGRPSCTASGVLGLTERDVCFSAAKLYFAYGLGNALTFPLVGRRDRAC